MPLNNPPIATASVTVIVILFARDHDLMANRQNLIIDYFFIFFFFGDPGSGK